MQMIRTIFKVFRFLPVVFCGLGFDFVETYISALFSLILVIPTIHFTKQIVFMILYSLYS